MNIESLTIKGNQTIALGKLTVLVGPNNAGKSRTLRDIASWITTGDASNCVLVQNVEMSWPAPFLDQDQDLLNRLSSLLLPEMALERNPSNPANYMVAGWRFDGGQPTSLYTQYTPEYFDTPEGRKLLLQTLGPYWVTLLDGESRLTVTKTSATPNMHTQLRPANLMQALRYDETGRERQLRDAFRLAFAKDIMQDDSGLQELMFRVGQDFDQISPLCRKDYHVMGAFPVLDNQGDGYKSFTSVVLSMLMNTQRIILLDEPEAFLHQMQARILGQWIARYTNTSNGQIVIATHNANFLAGILAAGVPVAIYRLNRRADDTTFTRITPEATARLANFPLLANQRILDALFASGVVIAEGDPDYHVYQTVATRFLNCQDLLFVQAYNKQVIHEIASLLRECMIPVCAIADVDIMNSGAEFRRLLEAMRPGYSLDGLIQWRDEVAQSVEGRSETDILHAIRAAIVLLQSQLDDGAHTVAGARSALRRIEGDASHWDHIKQHGLSAVDPSQRGNAWRIVKEAAELGVFIVPVGELEGWMDVGITRKRKRKWIVRALQQLQDGKCPLILRLFMQAVVRYMREVASTVAAGLPAES